MLCQACCYNVEGRYWYSRRWMHRVRCWEEQARSRWQQTTAVLSFQLKQACSEHNWSTRWLKQLFDQTIKHRSEAKEQNSSFDLWKPLHRNKQYFDPLISLWLIQLRQYVGRNTYFSYTLVQIDRAVAQWKSVLQKATQQLLVYILHWRRYKTYFARRQKLY